MDILKKNTIPTFQIVSRTILDTSQPLSVEITSEFTQLKQTISASIALLENQNYQLTLSEFPTGKLYEKLSYKIENVCLGKMIIVSENEDIQNYAKKPNDKYYS